VSRRTIALTDSLYRYLVNATLREPPLWRALRAETARLKDRDCQIAPEQGQFMALLVELLGARRAIEIGTFTGYSALWVASALPVGGRLICCDINAEWTAVAQRYWKRARLASKIDLRLAPAVQTLSSLLRDGAAGTFDFAFIDADKESYDVYYERILQLLRPGGLLAVDNALKGGRVVRPEKGDAAARAVDALNRKVQHDKRVTASLVPIGDGLLLGRRR
jgi:predicted O-methyltransferase YrrM